MKTMKPSILFPALLCMLFLLSVSSPASAVTRGVVTDSTLCTAITTTYCYTTIQSAVNAAVSGDSIQINTGSYAENITLPSTGDFSLSIYGTETGGVVLSGGSGVVFLFSNTVANTTMSITVKNITISGGSIGIQASGNVALEIYSNVFEELTNSAIITTAPLLAKIVNNTFYNNSIAVTRDTVVPIVKNNIFSSNTVATTINNASNLGNNCYFGNGDDLTGPREAGAVTGDPLFVSVVQGDFHLKSSSPCIDAGDSGTGGQDSVDGTANDIGAYGGSNSDKIPFPVSGLVISKTTSTTISLSWPRNNCYLIGGYKVYYGTSSGKYTVSQDAGNAITYDITGISGATAPTGAPVITNHDIANQTITLYWSTATVSGATGYEVRYDTLNSAPTSSSPNADAGNSTSYALSGLVNYTWYYINVTAYAEAKFYIAVKAYYAAGPASMLSDFSNEVSTSIGGRLYSATSSSAIYDYPEPISAYPDLPNSGCFIATAAYGSSSASQVQALREFRDRYLITTPPGRAFVRWYYTYGPRGARFLNEHPGWNPVARAALVPAVGMALFLTHTSLMTKGVSVMIISGLIVLALSRKKLRRSGGIQ